MQHCGVVSAFHAVALCSHVEHIYLKAIQEHITRDALQAFPLMNHQCLRTLHLDLTGSLIEQGVLCLLLRSITNGRVPRLTNMALNLQTNRYIEPGEMDCLSLLLSPACRLHRLTLILSGTTWDGDRVLAGCRSWVNLPSAMRHLTLHLGETGVSDWGIVSCIPVILAAHPNLQTLALHFNHSEIQTRRGLNVLVHSITKLQSLRSLDMNVSNCGLQDSGVWRFLGLLSQLRQLSLDISYNRRIQYRTKSAICELLAMLRHTMGSFRLWATHTFLPNLQGCGPLHLHTLSLSVPVLDGDGVPDFLRSCDTSTVNRVQLSFTGSKVGYQGCRRLGFLLMRFSSLQSVYLDLDGNNVRDVGAHCLFQSLSEIKSLSRLTLYLSYNDLTVCSMRSLCPLLVKPLVSLFVDLSGNPLGYDGVRCICNAVAKYNMASSQLWRVVLRHVSILTPLQYHDLLERLPCGVEM